MGAIYDGEWRYDMQHGQGTEKWINTDSVFTGEFVDGLRNGQGKWVQGCPRVSISENISVSMSGFWM